MKFSLHERTASFQYLKKADEIMVEYRDRRAIPDYAKKYPDACIALEVPPETQWEISEIKDYFILAKQKLVLCLPDIKDPRIAELKSAGIPFFWGYTVNTFWELEALVAAGASQARIGAPIFFDAEGLNRYKITKRVCANVAHEGYLPFTDGITGSWIRPEDVEAYEDVFDIIEFADVKDHKEEALFRIYAEKKNWPGRVDMIISNINTEAYNRMIPTQFVESRKKCGQRCKSYSSCRICERLLYLANPNLLKNYKEEVLDKAGEK
jgi:hypothetical protein